MSRQTGWVVLVAAAALALSSSAGGGEGGPPGKWYEEDRGRGVSDEGPRAGFASHLALYPVNRLADLLDVVTVQFGFGLGVHVNAHGTRALQVGAGGAAATRAGLDQRRLGVCNESKAEFSLLPFSAESFRRHSALGGFHNISTRDGIPWLYHGHRDYWGVGAEATAAVVNVGAEVHPGEVPDFVLGLFGIDYMRDDYPHRPLGREKGHLAPEDARGIKRVVVVPSRVTRERSTRMERAEGVGCYYYRYRGERWFGRLGTLFTGGGDREVCKELNGYLTQKHFDVHKELLERVERCLVVRRRLDVIDVKETLAAYRDHAVTKSRRGQRVRRLPNYAGLCRHYGADAVLDVRLWEWGVWRATGKGATMRVDCEFKLIAHPQNKVLLDVRLVPDVKEKRGMSLLDFARNEGDALIAESREAIDIVTTKFADIVCEKE